jgi:hypothetical protein
MCFGPPQSCRPSHPTGRTLPCQSLEVCHPGSRLDKPCVALEGRRARLVTNSKAVRPAMAAHLEPVSSLWCACVLVLRNSGSQDAAAVCACSAITHARVRAVQVRAAQYQPPSGQPRPCARLRQAGCGPHTQSQHCRLPSWASSAWIRGQCERCLVGSDGIAMFLLRPPVRGGMRPVRTMATQAGHMRQRVGSSNAWPAPVWRWPCMLISAS